MNEEVCSCPEHSGNKISITSILKYGPRTQKASGLVKLKELHISSVPSFIVLDLHDEDSILIEHATKFGIGENYFLRPAPMRPRHGFVDSRSVRTEEEFINLVNEVRKEDPDGEIIAMKKVIALMNIVATSNSMTFGLGNDGATSGRSDSIQISIPSNSSIHNSKGLNVKNLVNDEEAFFEFVWDGKNNFIVQMRGGPMVDSSSEYIPRETTVKEFVTVDPSINLLDWEKMMDSRKGEDGFVIVNPSGSLTNHFAIHAKLNEIPVVSIQPEIGSVLKQNSEISTEMKIRNLKYFRRGILLGNRYVTNCKNHSMESMVDMCKFAMFAIHGIGNNNSCKFHFLSGYAIIMLWYLIKIASLGEYRYKCQSLRKLGGRNDVYVNTINGNDRTHAALNSFFFEHWDSSYGGPAWGTFLKNGIELLNLIHLFTLSPSEDTMNRLLKKANFVVNLCHNNGWALNKFIQQDFMDRSAKMEYTSVFTGMFSYYKISDHENFLGQNGTNEEFSELRKNLLLGTQIHKSITFDDNGDILSSKDRAVPSNMGKHLKGNNNDEEHEVKMPVKANPLGNLKVPFDSFFNSAGFAFGNLILLQNQEVPKHFQLLDMDTKKYVSFNFEGEFLMKFEDISKTMKKVSKSAYGSGSLYYGVLISEFYFASGIENLIEFKIKRTAKVENG
jgi:hypothetical protein